ncbi:MAG: bacteriohemerythrin [Oryzomonas sp.]|uniref:bacteriohemerythrin n=1 Tax=Oryzomonas sp. TaxID=2855186 RepID=UPI00283B35C0|nr:bacteriohemerythrin [Oryzomonas sp.]MDR3580400.1 bacteriohemerythrin [Oryzomonas sp.]
MQYFYWNKSFEVGIADVDQQHRILVDIINSLAAAIVENGKLPEIQTLFSQLMQYATVHFHDEELIMSKSSLDEMEKKLHLQAHREFVEKTKEIILRPDLLKSEVSQQVLEFLTTWLIAHILGSDKKIAQALANEDVGTCREEQPLFEISSVERLLLGALTETERRFRLISDHTPVLIWVSDATGDRGFINKAWSEFVGVNEDSAHSIEWAKFIHPDDREAYLAKIGVILTAPQPAEVEYRLRHHKGTYHWFLERILPRIDSNNVLLGFIASSTDISGIKQAEELLSQITTVRLIVE